MSLKILQVPFGFFPDPVGGTETYVAALAQALREEQVDNVVAAPGPENDCHEVNGLKVRRFRVSTRPAIESIYGVGDAEAAAAFEGVLEVERPDIVHFHAFTPAVSVRTVRSVKRRGIPVVFTYHTPTVSCPRGTLLRWGSEVCDGKLDVWRCAGCTLHREGLWRIASRLVGRVPTSVGHMLARAGLSGGLWTGLRMTALVELRHGATRALLREVDTVVALCEWSRRLLLRIEVPRAKIVLSRHGLEDADAWGERKERAARQGPLRIAFLGRLSPEKGLHVVVDALSRIPDTDVMFDIFGLDHGNSHYVTRLRRSIECDERITLHDPLDPKDVVARLGDYDLMSVPSLWLETGPLVVLEAFAAGTPVLGSDLGGISELVRHDVDGLLAPAGAVDAWAELVRKLATDRSLTDRLRSNVPRPRSMQTVAQEMLSVYENLLATGGTNDERRQALG